MKKKSRTTLPDCACISVWGSMQRSKCIEADNIYCTCRL